MELGLRDLRYLRPVLDAQSLVTRTPNSFDLVGIGGLGSDVLDLGLRTSS